VAQFRAMTYLCVVNGASGICWFPWRPNPKAGEKLHQSDALRAVMLKTASELRDLTPVLLADDVSQTQTIVPADGVESMLKRHDGKTYLFVVNSGYGSKRIRVGLRGRAITSAHDQLGGRDLPVVKSGFTDQLEPLAVRVYLLKREETR
jgi:hypothetical protein